jgi:YbbR domain-containing protein
VGKLPENFILSDITIDPETIEVVGGKRILQNISTIYTEKIQLDNIKESGTTTVNLALNPASLKIAPGSKDKIKVNYVVKERSQEI